MTEDDQFRQPDGSGAEDETGEARAEAEQAGSPEQRLAALEAERNETRERMLRVAAEFENYKKRIRKEMAEGESKAKEQVLRDVLEVVDNLERALAVDEKSDVKSLQQGISLVLRLFQSKLDRYQVKPFESAGQPFDPRKHDAISQVPSPGVPPGAIVSEVQRGYNIGDRLLRPAMVVVAVGAPASQGGPANGSDGAGNEDSEK